MHDAATTVRAARTRAGLSLRELARRAGTSHPALVAYEAGRTEPSVETLRRVVGAAGFDLEVQLARRPAEADGAARGDELAEVLALAEQFPVRPPARHLPYPPFRRA